MIDTRTREGMVTSLARYLEVTEDELIQYIEHAASVAQLSNCLFDVDRFEKEIQSIVTDLKPNKRLDELYVFHLSRRLNNTVLDKSCANLKSLLLTKSDISQFLKQYGIRFIEKESHPVLVVNNIEDSLDDIDNSDVCYLRSRLGYNKGSEDYCINGFALGDSLLQNDYFKMLREAPEFIMVLARYLSSKEMVKRYAEESKYFIFTYKLPIEEIVFDGRSNLSNDEKGDYLIAQIAMRIMMYSGKKNLQSDYDNPIIRLDDEALVSADRAVCVDEIDLSKFD